MSDRLSMGGWLPPEQGVQAADLYARWLCDHGAEDTAERRKTFEAETGVTLTEEEK